MAITIFFLVIYITITIQAILSDDNIMCSRHEVSKNGSIVQRENMITMHRGMIFGRGMCMDKEG